MLLSLVIIALLELTLALGLRAVLAPLDLALASAVADVALVRVLVSGSLDILTLHQGRTVDRPSVIRGILSLDLTTKVRAIAGFILLSGSGGNLSLLVASTDMGIVLGLSLMALHLVLGVPRPCFLLPVELTLTSNGTEVALVSLWFLLLLFPVVLAFDGVTSRARRSTKAMILEYCMKCRS